MRTIAFIAATSAVLASVATAHAAPSAGAQAPLLVPLKTFAAAFNSGDRKFPANAFTDECTTIDEFDPFAWHGKGSIRVWYRETLGGTTRGYQHFRSAHEVLTLDSPQMIRRRGNNAYVAFATHLQYTAMGTRRVQHLDWTGAETRTPSWWKIAAQAWALLDDAASQSTQEARIPFRIDRGVIIFQALINGGGPYSFVFDPGAQGALTRFAAGKLGLPASDPAQRMSLRIGDAEIANLPLPVYPGDPADIFAGDPNAPPIAGALGPEILNRFAVRLDYAARTMTLTPLTSFTYTGHGVALPFTIRAEDNIPLVRASVDGIDGLFQYDVRAPASLVLFAPFLESSGLGKRYPSGSRSVAVLTVAGTTLKDVTARFGTARTGKFGTAAEAGLLGYGVLSKFTTTIDYARKVIYFEASPSPQTAARNARGRARQPQTTTGA